MIKCKKKEGKEKIKKGAGRRSGERVRLEWA